MNTPSNLPPAEAETLIRLLTALLNSPSFASHFYLHHPIPARRLALLADIISRLESGNTKDLTACIYRYGSMIREQDLLARQLFLWLLAMSEENPGLPEP